MEEQEWAFKLISFFEGFRSKPYLCTAGKPTIGKGTTSYPNGTLVTLKDPCITEEKADEYLKNYLEKFVFPRINKLKIQYLFQGKIYSSLCSLIYNCPKAYTGESIINALKAGDSDLLALAFNKYNKITKNGILVIDSGLDIRRGLEVDFFKDKWVPS